MAPVEARFIRPQGATFSVPAPIPSSELSRSLIFVVEFLRDSTDSSSLKRYADWWQHDGLHFEDGQTSFADLLETVKSPNLLRDSMPGDWEVRVGIQPPNGAWYLRFYVDVDAGDDEILGDYNLTLGLGLISPFESEIAARLSPNLQREDFEAFFSRVVT